MADDYKIESEIVKTALDLEDQIKQKTDEEGRIQCLLDSLEEITNLPRETLSQIANQTITRDEEITPLKRVSYLFLVLAFIFIGATSPLMLFDFIAYPTAALSSGIIAVGLSYISVRIFNKLVIHKERVKQVSASLQIIRKKRENVILNMLELLRSHLTIGKQFDSLQSRFTKSHETFSEMEESILDQKISEFAIPFTKAIAQFPNVKGDLNLLHLQQSLLEMEKQLAAARRAYNSSVSTYNQNIKQFPNLIIAIIGNFQVKSMLTEVDMDTNDRINDNLSGLVNQ